MKPSLLFFLPLLYTLLLSGCQNHDPKRDAQRLPNIILCMADDQGWGDMAYNGHPILKTPNFDSLAREGLRFDQFYAAAPVCSPTRGSVMTGRHPNRFGCFSWGKTLRPQEITIAEMLRDAGYVTGHFGKWHLGSVQVGSPVNPGESGFDEWLSAPNFFDNNPILSREGKAVPFQGESSMITVDAALEFIQKHESREKPYFAVVWFGSPHLPHQALEDTALYADETKALQHFYGEITAMDRAFGKLRHALKKLPSYNNTILWYCSDNGGLPNFGSTGGRGHKADIYEGGLRVPALMEWPDMIKKPETTTIPTNTSDIFLTLLEITGLQTPEDRPFDGISLLPLIKGEMETRTKPMGFWQYPGNGIRTPSLEWMQDLYEAQQRGDMIGDSSRLRLADIQIGKKYPFDTLPGHAAWLDWPWKLHRIQHQDSTAKFELYQLVSDPNEQADLASSEQEQVAKMTKALEDWQRSVVHSLNGEDY